MKNDGRREYNEWVLGSRGERIIVVFWETKSIAETSQIDLNDKHNVLLQHQKLENGTEIRSRVSKHPKLYECSKYIHATSQMNYGNITSQNEALSQGWSSAALGHRNWLLRVGTGHLEPLTPKSRLHCPDRAAAARLRRCTTPMSSAASAFFVVLAAAAAARTGLGEWSLR